MLTPSFWVKILTQWKLQVLISLNPSNAAGGKGWWIKLCVNVTRLVQDLCIFGETPSSGHPSLWREGWFFLPPFHWAFCQSFSLWQACAAIETPCASHAAASDSGAWWKSYCFNLKLPLNQVPSKNHGFAAGDTAFLYCQCLLREGKLLVTDDMIVLELQRSVSVRFRNCTLLLSSSLYWFKSVLNLSVASSPTCLLTKSKNGRVM